MQWHCLKLGGKGDADGSGQKDLRGPGLSQKPDLDEYR